MKRNMVRMREAEHNLKKMMNYLSEHVCGGRGGDGDGSVGADGGSSVESVTDQQTIE